ncbi:MAG: M20/M25/M40 family metallo-hydrolase [Deltaproteobacteria bacterium]|nr:M20/M25/M40 family metallo-hydrolase [Deltaproteobacteria bacterium]
MESGNSLKSLLIDLLDVPGVCGHEEPIRLKIEEWIRPWVDRLETDALGNLIATQEGQGVRRVALFAHMDELGLVVANITAEGFLRFTTLGGLDDRVLPATHLRVLPPGYPEVPGVVAWVPPHLADPAAKETPKTIPASELVVDVGAARAEEVAALGIQVGTPMVFRKQVSALANDNLASRGMDNRAGCAVQIKVLEAMAGIRARPTIHYVFTVQEEYGLRGAVTTAYGLQPDLALVVDTASAPDFPGVPAVYQGQYRLGQGPVLRLVDNRMITSPKLSQWAWDLAQNKKIPLQKGVTGGSTDAAAVQLARRGLAVLPVCFPCRYTHSLVETVSLRDLEAAVDLIREMLGNLPFPAAREMGG